MRTTNLLVRKQSGRASLGRVFFTDTNEEVDFSRLLPYVKGQEDIEIILRNSHLLTKNQPIEMCGYGALRIMEKAASLEEVLLEQNKPVYPKLAAEHPIILSFPPEGLWLTRPPEVLERKNRKKPAIENLETILLRTLPATSSAPTYEETVAIATDFTRFAERGHEGYHFWEDIQTEEFDGAPYSKLLLEAMVELSNRLKVRFLSPQVPVVAGMKWPSSQIWAHRFNMALGYFLKDKSDAGDRVPKLLYTIDLNSDAFPEDEWTPVLGEIIRDLKIAMELKVPLFDGISVSVRGLSRISLAKGRIRTLCGFMQKVNDIAHEHRIPVNYSRFGLLGLRAMDDGSPFTSFALNLRVDDILGGGADDVQADTPFGKVLNFTMGELWKANQVRKSLKSPNHGLPSLLGTRNSPTSLELESPELYRKGFSKPYNLAAFNDLGRQWTENVEAGETNPGQEALHRFEFPFGQWGAPSTR